MTSRSALLTALALTFGLAGSAGSALAQGYGYGSAAGAAASLGFTASPPVPQTRARPVVSEPASEPVTTGSIVRRDRTWTRLQRR